VLSQLVEEQIQSPQFGILGAVRVNVLQLNLALDAIGQTQPH
jgi:K+-transporting ATPase c subunit